jgi:AbrB family looped-hinge helix DNA binding protein
VGSTPSPALYAKVIFGENKWVNWVKKMATKGKYHSAKIYIPMDVRRTLGLEEGDEIEFSIVDEREARLLVKKADADQKLLELLDRPRKLGIKGKLTREEIYATR